MKRDFDGVQQVGKYGPFLSVLQAEAVDASTAYVLVDLSDTTNYKHRGTNAIILKSIALTTNTATDGIFDLWVGVITEVDATNGTAMWLHCFHNEHRDNATDNTDARFWQLFFDDLDLKVNAATAGSEYLEFVKSNISLAGNTLFQTDTGLASPVGAAGQTYGRPGAGDLVLYVEEVTNGGTLDFCISTSYDTR